MRRSKIICKLFNFNLEQELDSKRFLLCKNNNLVTFIQDGNVISVDNNLLNSIENNKDLEVIKHFTELGLYLDSLKG